MHPLKPRQVTFTQISQTSGDTPSTKTAPLARDGRKDLSVNYARYTTAPFLKNMGAFLSSKTLDLASNPPGTPLLRSDRDHVRDIKRRHSLVNVQLTHLVIRSYISQCHMINHCNFLVVLVQEVPTFECGILFDKYTEDKENKLVHAHNFKLCINVGIVITDSKNILSQF